MMNKDELRRRTKRFALDVVAFVEGLPRSRTADVLGRQLLRAATSVGANYRAACRAKSNADFIAKMGTVEEEADDCGYWLELLTEGNIADPQRIVPLLKEADELVAIAVSSIKTARSYPK